MKNVIFVRNKHLINLNRYDIKITIMFENIKIVFIMFRYSRHCKAYTSITSFRQKKKKLIINNAVEYLKKSLELLFNISILSLSSSFILYVFLNYNLIFKHNLLNYYNGKYEHN